MRKGLLSKEDAKTAGDKNVITRTLGSGLNGDRLVLYTDGLNNAIDDDRVLELALNNPPEEAVAEANKKGGKDNTTVIAAVFRTSNLKQ